MTDTPVTCMRARSNTRSGACRPSIKANWGNNETFGLRKPVVEVFKTRHRASWYQGQLGRNDFFFNVLADAIALAGEPSGAFAWAVYIDADPACGQIGGAGIPGFAVLPANDLRGLVGHSNRPPCLDEPADLAGICRWVGGLGHELGHAFGLPHPDGCETGSPACPSSALMWLGFREYPSTFLLEEDKALLRESPLFEPIAPLKPRFFAGHSCDERTRWRCEVEPAVPWACSGPIRLDTPLGHLR